MPLTTTTIGAYPKPDYVEVPDWFNIPVGPDTAGTCSRKRYSALSSVTEW